jgi:hypothetical protein
MDPLRTAVGFLTAPRSLTTVTDYLRKRTMKQLAEQRIPHAQHHFIQFPDCIDSNTGDVEGE